MSLIPDIDQVNQFVLTRTQKETDQLFRQALAIREVHPDLKFTDCMKGAYMLLILNEQQRAYEHAGGNGS